MMINRKIITQYIIILFVITLFSCSKDDEKEALDTYTSTVTDVLQADGSDIIDKNDTKVFLKGVAFGNDF